jgi:hypothetical protein
MDIEAGSLPKKIIGIASQADIYRVSWAIGETLGIHLKKDEPLSIRTKGQNHDFDLFYDVAENDVVYRMAANKTKGKYLCSAYKNIDFFLIVSDSDFSPKPDDLRAKLQQAEAVLGVFLLEPCPALRKAFINYSF